MDYLKIVLDGYCNPTDRKFLNEYFIRESKKAEKEFFYTREVFLTGCKDAVQNYLISDLYRQKSDARKELLEARQWAKEHDQELFNRTYDQEDNLNIESYTINLWHLTNSRYTGHMDYFEIMHISDTLDLLISIDNLIDAVKNIQPGTTGTEPPPAQKHSFPTIDKTKYNSDMIFEKFNHVLFECSKECFNSWLVNGCNHKETIKYIYTGRLSANTRQITLNFAQLRKFINMVTGDSENTKDAYYSAVFGLKIKTSSVKPSNQFSLKSDLRLCEI